MPRTEQKIMTGWEFALIKCKPRSYETAETYCVGMKNCDMPEGLCFEEVELPHDWAITMPFDRKMEEGGQQGFRDRWGIGWYRRKMTVTDAPGHRRFLEFGGVYENCTVWVNGICIGGHKYGYSTFSLEATKAFVPRENEIVVKVDNSVMPVDRWYSGCGIYRTVKLLTVEEKHLNPWEVVVQTSLAWKNMPEEKDASEEKGAPKGKGVEAGEVSASRAAVSAGEGSVSAVRATVSVDIGQNAPVRAALRPLGVVTDGQEMSAATPTGDRAAKSTSESAPDASLAPKSAPDVSPVQEFTAVSQDGHLTFDVENPLLWSAEKPNLYELTLYLTEDERECDELTLRIGIREVIMDAKRGMLVNRKPVKLQGVCLHQEAGCVGVAVRPELWRERLLNLKELGCNAIRAAHHTYAAEFLDLCDELGFYVYEECFDKWKGGLYGRYFDACWKQDVDAMVKRDRNRPSVVIWGVGNEVENQGQESMLTNLRMLKEYASALDSTRPVTYAMNPHFKRESEADLSKVKDIQQFVDEVSDTEIYDAVERVERIAKIAEIVDVISCNYQEQWYDLIHEKLPDKLILGTEIYEYFEGHYDQMQNFTQKNPSLEPFEKDYCIGGFIWTGYDYLGESMGWPAKGWSGALIHTNNERRPIAYVLQSYWSQKPMVHFSVMDYSLQDEGVKEHWDYPIYADHWHFPQFHKTVIPYMIASNCEEVRLFLNGKQFFIPRPSDCPNRVITGFLPWQPGTVEVIGINKGKEVCRQTTVTPGAAVKLEFDREVYACPRIRSATVAGNACRENADRMNEGSRQLLLTVRAKDEDGNPYFRESGRVFFRVEGPARIRGVDNGDITGSEPCFEDNIHLYHGCASVLVELAGEPGRVTVCADGSGLFGARAVILSNAD